MSNRKIEIETARLRVVDFDFPEGALTREILGSERDRDLFGNPAPYKGGRARALGLELCPPSFGLELRLQYMDQPVGEKLHVAMKPITSSDGEPRIFVVAHSDKGLSLDAARARPDDHWDAEDMFVFSLGTRSTGGGET